MADSKMKIVLVVCPDFIFFKTEILSRSKPDDEILFRTGRSDCIWNGKRYIYMSSPDSMRGFRDVGVSFWRGFERSDFRTFLTYASIQNLTLE